jgi:hypothetical protein
LILMLKKNFQAVGLTVYLRFGLEEQGPCFACRNYATNEWRYIRVKSCQ